MKRFIICVLDHETNTLSGPAPIFSDSLENARLYAEELAREVVQDTPVHIYELNYIDSVKLGFSWQRGKIGPRPQTVIAPPKKSKRSMGARRWTAEEERLLKRLVDQGACGKDIANVLHRTTRAIHTKCHAIGVGPRINKKAPRKTEGQ